jgi:hypothetical protein
MQNNLGSAPLRRGERESGTARLEEAAAYLAALTMFEPAGDESSAAAARSNLKRTEDLLASQRHCPPTSADSSFLATWAAQRYPSPSPDALFAMEGQRTRTRFYQHQLPRCPRPLYGRARPSPMRIFATSTPSIVSVARLRP